MDYLDSYIRRSHIISRSRRPIWITEMGFSSDNYPQNSDRENLFKGASIALRKFTSDGAVPVPAVFLFSFAGESIVTTNAPYAVWNGEARQLYPGPRQFMENMLQ